MKIAPFLPRWNQGERDWSFVKDPKSEIEAWEAREGVRLPSDYKSFMFKFNGGNVYPRLFKHSVPRAVSALMGRAERLAYEAGNLGEAPIGALIVDELGQVVGASHARVLTDNDPSKVAAMAAWRAAGSRDDWGRHSLVLTHGPDPIAYSMFKIFGFGQLIVGSDRVYPGECDGVRQLGTPVTVMNQGHGADDALTAWLQSNTHGRAREYLGATWR